MNNIVGSVSVAFIILTIIVIVAGEFLIRESKNSEKKIGISIGGVARTTLATQFILHIIATFFIFAIAIFVM